MIDIEKLMAIKGCSREEAQRMLNLLDQTLIAPGFADKFEKINKGLDVIKEIQTTFRCPICEKETLIKNAFIVKEKVGKKEEVATKGEHFNNGWFGSSGTRITTTYVQHYCKVRICKECASKRSGLFEKDSSIDLKKAEEYNAIVDI